MENIELENQSTEQTTQQVPTQQDPPSKKLYDGLVADKLYSKSYDEFKQKYSTPEAISKLHAGLVSDKMYSKGADGFVSQYFPESKKKATSTPSSKGSQAGVSTGTTSTTDTWGTSALNPMSTIKTPKQEKITTSTQDKNKPVDKGALKAKLDIATMNFTPQEKAFVPTARQLFDIKMTGGGKPVPTTLDESADQDKEDVGSRTGYWWNSFLKGIGSVSSGASDLMMQALTSVLPDEAIGGTGTPEQNREAALKKWREEVEPTVRTATQELAGSKISNKRQQQFDDEFFTSAVGGLAGTVPMLLGTKGSSLFLGSYDMGLETINNTEEGKKLPESVKSIFGVGVGAANAALEKIGIDRIFGKQSSKVATRLAIKTMSDLVKKSDAPITTAIFEQALNANAKNLKSKIVSAGGKLVESGISEFVTGGLQESANILAEEIVNKTQNKQVFAPSDWGEKASRVLKSASQEAAGGVIMGAASLPFSKTRNYISEKVAEAKTPEDIQKLKEEIISQAQSGKFNQEEVAQTIGLVDKYASIHSKIPADSANKKDVAEDIVERDELQQHIDEKKAELQNADVAFKPEIEKEILALQNRYDEINNNILNKATQTEAPEVAEGKTPVYKIGGKEVSRDELIDYIKNKKYEQEENPVQLFSQYDKEVQDLIDTVPGEVEYEYETEDKTKEPVSATKSIGQVETTVKEEVKPIEVKEGDVIELPAQVKGGLPRKMIFEEGEWKQQVGDKTTGVSENVKQQSQTEFEKLSKPTEEKVVVGEEVKLTPEEISDLNEQSKELNKEYIKKQEELLKSGIKSENIASHPEMVAIKNKMDAIESQIKGEEVTKPKLPKTEIETELEKHFGIESEENKPGEVSEPIKSSDEEGLNKLAEKHKNDTVKSAIISAAKTGSKFIKSILPDIEINIHDGEDSYNEAVSKIGGRKGSGGNIYAGRNAQGKYVGRIDINLSKANERTIGHEIAHAVLGKAFGDNPKMFDSFRQRVSQLLTEPNLKELNAFADRYSKIDKDIVPEEFIAELTGMLNANQAKLMEVSPTTLQKIASLINDVVSKVTMGKYKPFEDIRDTKAITEFLKTIAEGVSTGEAITETKLAELSKPLAETKGSIANASQKVKFQSDFKHEKSGIEWRYFKNSDAFKKLVDEGYVTFDKGIEDFSGAVVLHSPDAAFSGQILKDGQLIANGKGGVYYPLVFHANGDFWAATARGAASLAKTLNEARAKSPDGKIKMVLVSAPVDKLMSSSLNGIGLMDILSSKAFSDKSGITQEQLRKAIIKGVKTTEKLKLESKDGMKPSQKSLPKISGNETLNELTQKLKEFYPSENSDFPVRKSLNQNILDGVASYSSSKKVADQLLDFLGEGSFNEKLKTTGGRLSKANLTRGFSNVLAEPTLRGEESGKIYAVIELAADVEPVKTSEHESYPYSLRSVDKNEKPYVHILKNRDYWYNHVKDKSGNIIGEDKITQSKVLPASAGISSVVELAPSKVEEVSPLAEKAKPQFTREQNDQDIISASVNVAPLYSTKVKTVEEAQQLHNSEFYKEFKRQNEELAKAFGLTIDEQIDGVGGFDGVSEATTYINVTGNFEDIVKFSALRGALSPEVQESTIAGMYIKEGDPKHNGNKVEIGIDNTEAAMKAARDAGFENAGYTLLDGEISFFDIFEYHDDDFDKKIDIFGKKYKEYGGQITREETHAVRSEYIDASRRKNIIAEIKREGVQQFKGREGVLDVLDNAEERNESFLKWKEINKSEALKEYKVLRAKQIELGEKGEVLDPKELNRIKELEQELVQPLASIISTDKKSYEQAKKEIEAIADDVVSIVNDGFVSKFGIKRPSRAAIKVVRWYESQPNLLGDGARTNIIVNTDADADIVHNEIKRRYSTGLDRRETVTTELGYPKRLTEIKTKSGKISEIQVMTPQGYLAKDGVKFFPEDKQSDAKKSLQEVRQRLGWEIPDGVGHYFYEINRDVNIPKELRDEATAVSNKYYDAFLTPESKLTDAEFRADVQKFKDNVDKADKSKWDEGNDGKSPEELDTYLKSKSQLPEEEIPTTSVEETTKALEEKFNPDFKNTIVDKLSKFDEQIANKKFPSALEVAEHVLPRNIFNKYKALYELAARNNINVSNEKLEPGTVGAWVYNNIQLNKDVSKYYLSDYNEFAEVLNHEIIHGLISKGINYKRYELHNDLQDVMDKVADKFDSASDEVKNIIAYIQDTRREYKETKYFGIDDYKEVGNLEELITYAFTNKEFADFLDSIPASKDIKVDGKSIFQQLKNIIRDFISKIAKSPTALDEINSVLDKYFDTSWNEKQFAERNKEYNWGAKFKADKNIFDKYNNDPKIISEAYHKGKDAKLIKAVDAVLGVSELPEGTKSRAQFSQSDDNIKSFIEGQRAKGKSDAEIKKVLESYSSKLGIDAAKIDELLAGEVKPEVEPEVPESKEPTAPRFVGLSKKEIAKQVEEFSMFPPSRRAKITDIELNQMADDAIAGGYDVEGLVEKLREGNRTAPNDLEVVILNKYAAALNEEQTQRPSKETLKKYTEAIDAAKKGGSMAGAALRQFKNTQETVDNLSNFLADKQSAQGAPLDNKQIAEETAKYNELKKAKDELEAELKIQREKYDQLIAEVGLNKAKAIASKAAKKSTQEYKAERSSIIEKARAALKDLRSGKTGLNSTVPGVNELMAIAPHVKDYVKSLLSQGIDKLDNVITQAHAEFKDVLEGLSPKDIRDIIAGKHDEIKETKNELAAKMRLLQREAKLLNELDAARKGEESAKTPKERVTKARRIEELEAQIQQTREINREDVEPIEKTNGERLASRQKQLLNKISKLTQDLKDGNFAPEKQALPPLQLDRKTIMMMDKVAQLEQKINNERQRDEYEKKAKWIKGYDKVMQVLGLRRIVQSALDLSVSFRQGATLLSPRQIDVWAKSFKNEIASVFSPTNYNNLMYQIRHSRDYHDMVDDGIVFNELETVNAEQRNEEFQRSFVYDIPVLKEPLLASQRAADGFLNTARYELYMKFKANLERQGITRQSDPKAYQDAAKWAMNMTGRGNLIKALEESQGIKQILGNTFYGARLMASRFNMLNINTYRKLSPGMRKEAIKDIVAWVGTTMAVGAALAATSGAQISLDPDDSEFLQLKYGNKKYDITGGMAVYLRTFLRLTNAAFDRATKSKKEADKSTAKAGKSTLSFFRNKLSPNTSYAADAMFGKSGGQEFDPYDAVKMYPMYTDDIIEAYKEDGAVSLATVLVPNLIGIGYQSYEKSAGKQRKERKEGKERKKRKE